MITLVSGDLFRSNAEALVNPVNCVGIMGKGLAAQFKKIFPGNFASYKRACESGSLRPGRVLIYKRTQSAHPRYIVNLPTKRHWKGKSRAGDIEVSLYSLVSDITDLGIRSVAIPPLGCGHGGLDWKIVKPLIESIFQSLKNVDVKLYPPPGSASPKKSKHPKMTVERAMLISLMDRYLAGLMDPFVTIEVVHKLSFLAKVGGVKTRLIFDSCSGGPTATNLRDTLKDIEGHLISGYYVPGAELRPSESLLLVPSAVVAAKQVLDKNASAGKKFRRVAHLIKGFETPFGLELLSKILWGVRNGGIRNRSAACKAAAAWVSSSRLTERHIQIAWDKLAENHWVD